MDEVIETVLGMHEDEVLYFELEIVGFIDKDGSRRYRHRIQGEVTTWELSGIFDDIMFDIRLDGYLDN